MRFIHFGMHTFQNKRTTRSKLIQGTIAYERDGQTITLGMSFLHPKDQFVKAEGRQAAQMSFLEEPVSFKLPTTELSGHEINERILRFIEVTYPSIPNFPMRLHHTPVEIQMFYRHEIL